MSNKLSSIKHCSHLIESQLAFGYVTEMSSGVKVDIGHTLLWVFGSAWWSLEFRHEALSVRRHEVHTARANGMRCFVCSAIVSIIVVHNVHTFIRQEIENVLLVIVNHDICAEGFDKVHMLGTACSHNVCCTILLGQLDANETSTTGS